jgi:hypothetical protein
MMKMQDRAGRELSARDVALAACRELVKAIGDGEAGGAVRRAAVLARFALAMKD